MERHKPVMPRATAKRLGRRFARDYSIWVALFGVATTSVVFTPGLVQFAAGAFPIAWVLDLHGALMATWLALFFVQASFAAASRLALHERLGTFGNGARPAGPGIDGVRGIAPQDGLLTRTSDYHQRVTAIPSGTALGYRWN